MKSSTQSWEAKRGVFYASLILKKLMIISIGILYLRVQKMGFEGKWRNRIKWCISTCSYSVLINDNPTGFFKVPGAKAGVLCHVICFSWG